MPTLSLTAELSPDDFTGRLAAVLADQLAAFSVDPTRPTESRVFVRATQRRIWVHILSTRHSFAHLSLCGEVSRAPAGGSRVKFRRRLAAAQSWFVRFFVVAFLALPTYQLPYAWSRGAGDVGVVLVFGALAGALLVGIFSIGRTRAEAEIAALEARVGAILEAESARRATA